MVTGLAAVAALAAGVFWMQRGAHLELTGSIVKVRTLAVDDKASLAVIDFRFANIASYPFVVRDVTVEIADASGKVLKGRTIPDTDARSVFDYYPALGPRANESLITRASVPPHAQLNRMVMVRFEVPEATVAGRKALTMRIAEVDGAVSELKQP